MSENNQVVEYVAAFQARIEENNAILAEVDKLAISLKAAQSQLEKQKRKTIHASLPEKIFVGGFEVPLDPESEGPKVRYVLQVSNSHQHLRLKIYSDTCTLFTAVLKIEFFPGDGEDFSVVQSDHMIQSYSFEKCVSEMSAFLESLSSSPWYPTFLKRMN